MHQCTTIMNYYAYTGQSYALSQKYAPTMPQSVGNTSSYTGAGMRGPVKPGHAQGNMHTIVGMHVDS